MYDHVHVLVNFYILTSCRNIIECSAAGGLPPGHLSRREFAKGEERQKSELLAIGAAKRRCGGGKTAKTKFVSTEAESLGPRVAALR